MHIVEVTWMITNLILVMCQIGKTDINWKSKKQAYMGLSTAEAQYIALASNA